MPLSPLVDCHLHTAQFSGDAYATLEEFISRGRELGLAALCTTEHVDFDPQDYCYGHYDYAQHLAEREEVRARPVDGLSVLIGVEVDYQVRFEPEVREFMDAADYDFVIGSVHYAQGRYASSDSYFAGEEREAYSAYLNEALQAARSGLFDVLGHLDIVKRRGVQHYGPFDPARYAQAIEAILRACVDTGTGLEINASGLREAPRETYPTLPVIRRYRELGGEILTVGSDAHKAIDLARGIPDAVALAREAGFRAITLFVDRQPRWLPIST